MEVPSLTQTWHNASYPAISPTKSSNSVTGKTVFITGGGAGIGLATARAFAAAGASTVAISGRTASTLRAAKLDIETTHAGVTVLTFVADVTDQDAVTAAFSTVGKVDILVHNAGYMPDLAPIAQASLKDWWAGFDINVKGAFIVVQAFLKVAAADAIVVDVTTGVAHFPAFPGFSGYGTSKLAGHKFFDSVQAENPSLHVVHVHPGVVQTDMGQKSIDAGAKFDMDDSKFGLSFCAVTWVLWANKISSFFVVELPASFTVWACSAEARFLKGKTVWANWDVEGLKARKADIEGGNMLTTSLEGMSAFKYTSWG